MGEKKGKGGRDTNMLEGMGMMDKFGVCPFFFLIIILEFGKHHQW